MKNEINNQIKEGNKNKGLQFTFTYSIYDIMKKQIKEIEQENLIYIEQETKDNISDLIARRSLKERGLLK